MLAAKGFDGGQIFRFSDWYFKGAQLKQSTLPEMLAAKGFDSAQLNRFSNTHIAIEDLVRTYDLLESLFHRHFRQRLCS